MAAVFQYFPIKLGHPFIPGSLLIRIITWISLLVLATLVSYLALHPELSFAAVTLSNFASARLRFHFT